MVLSQGQDDGLSQRQGGLSEMDPKRIQLQLQSKQPMLKSEGLSFLGHECHLVAFRRKELFQTSSPILVQTQHFVLQDP